MLQTMRTAGLLFVSLFFVVGCSTPRVYQKETPKRNAIIKEIIQKTGTYKAINANQDTTQKTAEEIRSQAIENIRVEKAKDANKRPDEYWDAIVGIEIEFLSKLASSHQRARRTTVSAGEHELSKATDAELSILSLENNPEQTKLFKKMVWDWSYSVPAYFNFINLNTKSAIKEKIDAINKAKEKHGVD